MFSATKNRALSATIFFCKPWTGNWKVSGLIVTMCSEQLPRREVKRVDLLWRIAYLL
jgi:hypothetical protein